MNGAVPPSTYMHSWYAKEYLYVIHFTFIHSSPSLLLPLFLSLLFVFVFFFLHYFFIFFWTTQSVEWLDDSLNNQISEVRFPERRYKAQTILRVTESVLKAVALGVKLSIGKAVPSPAHTETAWATDILKSPQPSWRGSVLWTTLYLSCIFVPSSFTINTFLP